MSVQYTIENQDDITWIKAAGQMVTLDEIVDYVTTLAEEIHELKTRLVLVDHRELTGKGLSYFDKYDFVSQFATKHELRSIKWAVVTHKERTQSRKDFETMARNRGYALLGFANIDDATQWLRK